MMTLYNLFRIQLFEDPEFCFASKYPLLGRLKSVEVEQREKIRIPARSFRALLKRKDGLAHGIYFILVGRITRLRQYGMLWYVPTIAGAWSLCGVTFGVLATTHRA